MTQPTFLLHASTLHSHPLHHALARKSKNREKTFCRCRFLSLPNSYDWRKSIIRNSVKLGRVLLASSLPVCGPYPCQLSRNAFGLGPSTATLRLRPLPRTNKKSTFCDIALNHVIFGVYAFYWEAHWTRSPPAGPSSSSSSMPGLLPKTLL